MHLQCIAYKDDGSICRQPATILDEQRGGMVCEAHPPQSQQSTYGGAPEEGVTRMPQTAAREHLLEGLLGDCVFALEALLTSPDLNLDCLEQATRGAIEIAHETLDAVKAALAAPERKE